MVVFVHMRVTTLDILKIGVNTLKSMKYLILEQRECSRLQAPVEQFVKVELDFLGLTDGRTLRVAMIWSTLLGFVPLALIAAWQANADLLWASLATFMAARTVTLGMKTGATLRAAPSEP